MAFDTGVFKASGSLYYYDDYQPANWGIGRTKLQTNATAIVTGISPDTEMLNKGPSGSTPTDARITGEQITAEVGVLEFSSALLSLVSMRRNVGLTRTSIEGSSYKLGQKFGSGEYRPVAIIPEDPSHPALLIPRPVTISSQLMTNHPNIDWQGAQVVTVVGLLDPTLGVSYVLDEIDNWPAWS